MNGPERERAILRKILQLVQPLEELLSAEGADFPRLQRTVSATRGLANAPDLPAASVAKQALCIQDEFRAVRSRGEVRGNVRPGHFWARFRPSVRLSVSVQGALGCAHARLKQVRLVSAVHMVFAGSYRESRGSPSNGTETAFAYGPKRWSRRR
jgi:hypothetical protein